MHVHSNSFTMRGCNPGWMTGITPYTYIVGGEKMHAYLIMAHHRPDLLRHLLDAIDDPRNAIYVHIDAKSNVTNWDLTTQYSKLTRIPSLSVNWAGYTQIECTYRLLETATKDAQYQ